MSHAHYSDPLLPLVRNIIWAQWNRLGLNGTGGINRYSVDIESALIAASIGARLDGRLYEGVWTWLQHYGAIVNAERLATLIGELKSEWAARFLGSLLELCDAAQWKGVMKKCKSLCRPSWQTAPLLLQVMKRDWRTPDPILAKWGIQYDALVPQQKLQAHETTVHTNGLIQYRYLYGTVLRADVLYLLSISHQSGSKRESDFLTSVRLADRLHCHLSTIHRIQKDLEDGGFIEAVDTIKARRAAMTTWRTTAIPFLPRDPRYDLGLIHWRMVNRHLVDLFRLVIELRSQPNEMVAKARLQQFQADAFPLFHDHAVPVPTPHGAGLRPLKTYSSETLIGMLHQTLTAFYRILCCIILVRCRGCQQIFDAPIQGDLASMATALRHKNRMACPHCHTKLITKTSDFFYLNGVGQEQRFST